MTNDKASETSAESRPAPFAGRMSKSLLTAVWATWLGVVLAAALLGDMAWGRWLVASSLSALVAVAASFGSRVVEQRCRQDIARTAAILRTIGSEEPTSSERDSDASSEGGDEKAPLARAARSLQTRFDQARTAKELARSSRENARRARGLLFAGVSHDLKGPLNALLGFADLMLLDPLTEGQRESLDLIISRGRELVALVETLLDSARVEAGQLGVTSREVDLTQVLNDARDKACELVHADKEVQLVFDDQLPRVSVDAAHLTRAFALVIAHALKSRAGSSPDLGAFANGGKLGASEPDAVVVRARNVGDAIRVDVEHRAAGPTAAALEELYFTEKRGRGLRLGLRLARTIFELQGGRIEVLEKTNGRPAVSCFVRIAPPHT